MNNYKYFSDVLKNGYFTETPCQFCGSSEHCLEGSFFDRDDNLVSICLNCFDKRKVSVDIPSYIADRVVKKQNENHLIYQRRNVDRNNENMGCKGQPQACGGLCVVPGENRIQRACKCTALCGK